MCRTELWQFVYLLIFILLVFAKCLAIVAKECSRHLIWSSSQFIHQNRSDIDFINPHLWDCLVSIHWFSSQFTFPNPEFPSFNSDCGRDALAAEQICKSNGLPNRRIIVCEMLWLRSNFARVQELAVIERLLWLRSSFARVWWLAVIGMSLPWLRNDTNLIEIETQKEQAVDPIRSRAADSKNSRFDWNRGSREQIVNQTCFLSSW